MRVIAGALGGRTFESPRGHRTHPMSDKIRGALFNALGDIEDLRLLDAYAGSGAIGIEAVSRGAASVLMLEVERGASETIADNIRALGIADRAKAIHANAAAWSNRHPHEQFDIVVCDPPYDDIQPDMIEKKLTRHVRQGGILVLSLPPHGDVRPGAAFELLRNKAYGDASLYFYRRNT